MFAPPTREELSVPVTEQPADLFAPPKPEELEAEETGFFDKPALETKPVTATEIQQIADKYKVDPKYLRDVAPYLGAKPEDLTWRDIPQVASYVVNIPLGGAIRKGYKMAQPENVEKALDELENLGASRASWLQFGSEIVSPGIASKSKAIQAGAGAVYGASAAPAGEELEGAVTGAGIGLVLGKLMSPKASKVEKQLIQKEVADNSAQLEKGMQDVLSKRQESEDEILRILSGNAELDSSKAEKIVSQQLSPDEVSKLIDGDSEASILLRARTEKQRPELIRDLGYERAAQIQLAENIVEDRALSLAKSIDKGVRTKDEALDILQDYAKRQGGSEALSNKYKLISEEAATEKYIRDSVIRGLTRGDDVLTKAANTISDNQFVLRDIDQRYGSKLEPVFGDLNKSINRMSFAKQPFQKSLYNLYKIGGKRINQEAVATALDTGKGIEQLDPASRKVYEGMRKFYTDIRDFVNAGVREKDPSISPLSIPKLEHYLPHISKPIHEVLNSLEDKMLVLQKQVGDVRRLSAVDIEKLAPELSEGIKWYSNNEAIQSGKDLLAKYKDLFSREGKIRMSTQARAAMERKGTMPSWLREKDLYTIANSYMNNTLKHLYLRNGMDTIASLANRIEKAGGDIESRYVRDILTDMQGIRKGTFAAKTATVGTEYQRKLDRIGQNIPGLKPALAVAKAIPDVLSDFNRMIYPNLLGLNPKSLLMQSTQSFVKTAPELGNKYGYGTVLRGTIHALLNMPRQLRRVEEMGLQPAEFVRKYSRPVAEGIRRNSLYAVPMEVAQKMGDASMYLYTKLDSLNRAIALSTADLMASDLSRGSKLAQESLLKFPRSIQNLVRKAPTEQEKAAILGKYLNDVTQYNYNKASMSEYGRTMGPIFSTFSKWPTATAGEIISEYRDKGTIRGSLRVAEKFAVPLIMLQAADMLLFGEDVTGKSEDEKSDILKKFVGSSGLSVSSPIAQMPEILSGEFFTPPVIDALVKGIVIPSMQGEGDKIVKGLDTVVKNYTPGSVYARFLTDDLVTYITGERPEGATFVERTQEGARKLAK